MADRNIIIEDDKGNRYFPYTKAELVEGAETPSGAQAKADKALADAKAYTDEQIAAIGGGGGGSQVAVLKGVHFWYGGSDGYDYFDMPIPEGYTEDQCVFYAAIGSNVYEAAPNYEPAAAPVFVSTDGRRLNVFARTPGGGGPNIMAHYLVIGIK